MVKHWNRLLRVSNSILGDIHNWIKPWASSPSIEVRFVLSRGLDKMAFRSPFQPKLFCNSTGIELVISFWKTSYLKQDFCQVFKCLLRNYPEKALTRFQKNLEWSSVCLWEIIALWTWEISLFSLPAEDRQTQILNKLKMWQGFYHLKNGQER